MGYVLGIDLGTGSLKGILMNKKGQIIATSSADYELLQPQKGFMEQNPIDWVTACRTILTKLKTEVADFTEKLEGISFSGQMHSLVLLGEKNEVLRPAILWNDTRTTAQCERLMTEFKEELVAITSNVALEGFTLPKILWVQENEPELWSQVRHMMLPKDYLGFWMTDHYYMDYSDASGTIMLDMDQKAWSQDILDKYNIPREYLPTLIESSGMIGLLKEELIEEVGFTQAVKVFAGGADNACAAVGSGVLAEGTGMISIGTSGVFLSYETQNHTNYQGKLHLFNHGVKDSYYSMGVTLAAGHSLTWFKETFAKDLSYDELLSGIEKLPAGSNGLLFTPYIVGERTPHTDSKIRGSFIGLDTNHTLKNLTRAVLEGITFSLRDCKEQMTVLTDKTFEQIISVGGGAKNKEWLQIQADVFNAKIVCLESEQGPGVGAAMIAALGLGWFQTMQACAEQFVNYREVIEPNPEQVVRYNDIYREYRKIYPATKEICHDLTDLN